MPAEPYERQRASMVEQQLRRRGIDDERVLAAMATVPREAFVSERLARRAYADSALPIPDEQTISQPWIVAAICQALELEGEERVLEVGTGSGYSTAVLAQLCASVVSVERFERLARTAGERIARLGCADRVEIRVGDGSLGAPDEAPFDAIAVHASAPAPPPALLEQLATGGRLVLPVAEPGADELICLTRSGDDFTERRIAPCRFVPLIGAYGFAGPAER
jgi:protein-L-isoaspartate(D-aspartate) O-methyltransferase